MPIDEQPSVTGAAYGLRIAGFEDPALSGRGFPEWPLVTVSQELGEFAPLDHRIGEDRAEVADHLVIERESQQAVFRMTSPLPTDQLVHPILTWIGAVFAHWQGRLGMHGGAFVGGDGAWMVLAQKGGGKSSTMAALFTAGHEILADDLVVIDQGIVMPGPRFVDLKEEATRPQALPGATPDHPA